MINFRLYLLKLGSGERIGFGQHTLCTVIRIFSIDVLEVYRVLAG